MRNLLTILIVVFFTTGCHRKAIPDSTFQDTTTIAQKDSVVIKDTTIITPAKEITLEFLVDSLLAEQKRLQGENYDSAIYARIPIPSVYKDSTHRQLKDTSLSASIYMNSLGWIRFSCKEDSLKQVISNLTVAYAQLYVTKQSTRIVPGPVKIESYIPKWMWWWFGISLFYLIFKIGLLTFTTASGTTSVIKLITSIFKK